MVFALLSLGDYVPPSPRSPSPPYFRSLLPSATRIAEIEEGDSRESVDRGNSCWLLVVCTNGQ